MLDDTYATLYPGGIFNNGFALGWAKDRQADARPSTSSGGGQGWASKRIAAGDKTCRANQALRLQAPDVLREIRANAYRRGAATDALAPATFVHDIDVPVFLAGAWQDQETGSHFANMLSNFSPDIPMKVTVMNGVHQDSLAPAVLSEWIEFLDFYVAKRIPSVPPADARAGHDRPVPSVRAGRRRWHPTASPNEPDYASALRAYEAEPRVRVLFDVGAGNVALPAFSATAPSFPLPGTTARTWYLGNDGALTDSAPVIGGRGPVRVRPVGISAHDEDDRRRPHARRTTGSRSPPARPSATSPRRSPPTPCSSAPAASTCGCGPRPPTSTSR